MAAAVAARVSSENWLERVRGIVEKHVGACGGAKENKRGGADGKFQDYNAQSGGEAGAVHCFLIEGAELTRYAEHAVLVENGGN